MIEIEHKIALYSQTPEVMCGPTSLAMQLSADGVGLSPSEVFAQIQHYKRPEESGFTSQELAIYCLSIGFLVDFYSFDGRVLDYAWNSLDRYALQTALERLCHVCQTDNFVDAPKLRYALSYLAFLKAGGTLHIEPYVSTRLILELLKKGPVGTAVAFNVFAAEGKRNLAGHWDPFKGQFGTHSVLIYGYSEVGGFLIADPAPGRGRITLSPEHLLAAITAAQVENDNTLFLLRKS